MAEWLRQSTAKTLKLGPFLDENDGKTAETGLTISQADIRLSKNGAAFAQTNNVAGATHDENGWYDVPADTTDIGTLGFLMVSIHKSGAMPVWREFFVLPANVWDSLFDSDNLHATGALSALLNRLIEVLSTKRYLDRTTGVQSHYNTAGDTVKYTTTPSEPDASTRRETVAEV